MSEQLTFTETRQRGLTEIVVRSGPMVVAIIEHQTGGRWFVVPARFGGHCLQVRCPTRRAAEAKARAMFGAACREAA